MSQAKGEVKTGTAVCWKDETGRERIGTVVECFGPVARVRANGWPHSKTAPVMVEQLWRPGGERKTAA